LTHSVSPILTFDLAADQFCGFIERHSLQWSVNGRVHRFLIHIGPSYIGLGRRSHSNRNGLPSRRANNCDDCLLDTCVQSGPERHDVAGRSDHWGDIPAEMLFPQFERPPPACPELRRGGRSRVRPPPLRGGGGITARPLAREVSRVHASLVTTASVETLRNDFHSFLKTDPRSNQCSKGSPETRRPNIRRLLLACPAN
jgi:hypothetical protein